MLRVLVLVGLCGLSLGGCGGGDGHADAAGGDPSGPSDLPSGSADADGGSQTATMPPRTPHASSIASDPSSLDGFLDVRLRDLDVEAREPLCEALAAFRSAPTAHPDVRHLTCLEATYLTALLSDEEQLPCDEIYAPCVAGETPPSAWREGCVAAPSVALWGCDATLADMATCRLEQLDQRRDDVADAATVSCEAAPPIDEEDLEVHEVVLPMPGCDEPPPIETLDGRKVPPCLALIARCPGAAAFMQGRGEEANAIQRQAAEREDASASGTDDRPLFARWQEDRCRINCEAPCPTEDNCLLKCVSFCPDCLRGEWIERDRFEGDLAQACDSACDLDGADAFPNLCSTYCPVSEMVGSHARSCEHDCD